MLVYKPLFCKSWSAIMSKEGLFPKMLVDFQGVYIICIVESMLNHHIIDYTKIWKNSKRNREKFLRSKPDSIYIAPWP